MEKQLEKQAAAAPADSGEDGGLPSGAGAQKHPEDQMTLLLRLRAQTKQQLLEYKSMVDARIVTSENWSRFSSPYYRMSTSKEDKFKASHEKLDEEKTPEEIIPEKQIETKIEDLENEIEEVKVAFEMKKLALDRMQLSTVLRKNLEESNIQNSELMENMKHILKLNKVIMTSQQESWDLDGKLLNVKKKRFELKRASEQKFLEIQTAKNKQKDDLDSMENSDKIKTLKQKLQMEIQITTVIQHVFQNLIMGSKVNWAEDPALKEIVLQLEKNLTMI